MQGGWQYTRVEDLLPQEVLSKMTKPGSPKWVTEGADGIIVRLHIQPKASRSEISGEHGEGETVRLKVRIAAPPTDGEANEELLHFLKKLTKIPASRIHILRGKTSRSKDVLFHGASVEEIEPLLIARLL